MTHLSRDDRRAFLSAPDPQRYFPAASIEDARQRIARCIARNEGPALLVGGAGLGKSLLLAALAEQFAQQRTVVNLLGGQICTRRALLQSILSDLALSYKRLDEGELRLTLLRHIRGEESSPRRLLLLVDEADALPARLLEELRLLTNTALAGAPLVSVVLAGGQALEERFADPALDGFSQRIAARCYLAPLTREETFQFVRAQVAATGMRADRLFGSDALSAIHAATGGVPRLVNQLGDQLVWTAEETGCTPLDASLVQQAWSDLQQLPAPWNAGSSPAVGSQMAGAIGGGTAAGGVIEFGELDDDGPGAFHSFAEEVEQFHADQDEFEASTSTSRIRGLADDELLASISIDAARPRRSGMDLSDVAAKLDAAEELIGQLDRPETPAESASAALSGSSPVPSQALRTRLSEFAPAKALTPPPVVKPVVAEDPFNEAFEEEEVVLDRYSTFEANMLRVAPQVINREDRAFSGEVRPTVAEKAPAPLAAAVHRPSPPTTNEFAVAGWVATPAAANDAALDAGQVAMPVEFEVAVGSGGGRGPIPPLTVVSLDTADLANASNCGEERAFAKESHAAFAPRSSHASTPVGDVLILEDGPLETPTVVPARQFRRLFSMLESSAARSMSG